MGSRGPLTSTTSPRSSTTGSRTGPTRPLLDDKVRRDLRMLFASGAIDGESPAPSTRPPTSRWPRRIAEEGMVLLKNEGAILPSTAGEGPLHRRHRRERRPQVRGGRKFRGREGLPGNDRARGDHRARGRSDEHRLFRGVPPADAASTSLQGGPAGVKTSDLSTPRPRRAWSSPTGPWPPPRLRRRHRGRGPHPPGPRGRRGHGPPGPLAPGPPGRADRPGDRGQSRARSSS
jgi:hypothetical protein